MFPDLLHRPRSDPEDPSNVRKHLLNLGRDYRQILWLCEVDESKTEIVLQARYKDLMRLLLPEESDSRVRS